MEKKENKVSSVRTKKQLKRKRRRGANEYLDSKLKEKFAHPPSMAWYGITGMWDRMCSNSF